MTTTTQPITLYFTKHFTSGLLVGLTHSGSTTFPTVDAAYQWATKHRTSPVKPARCGGSSAYLVIDPTFQNTAR